MKIFCTQLHCECVRCIRIIFIYSLRSEAKHNHQFLEAQKHTGSTRTRARIRARILSNSVHYFILVKTCKSKVERISTRLHTQAGANFASLSINAKKQREIWGVFVFSLACFRKIYTQFCEVSKIYSNLTRWRLVILSFYWLVSRFTFNMVKKSYLMCW